MWLVITYFADPCLKSIFVVWWSFLSHEEKLFRWRFEILEIQLSVGAACGCGEGMARRDREKVSFFQQGALGTLREITRLDYVRKWYGSMIFRTENRVWKQCVVQDFLARDEALQPQDGSKFIGKSGSKQAGSLGGVSISHPNHSYSRTWHYPVHEK